MNKSMSIAQQLELKAQQIKIRCGPLQVAIAIDGSGLSEKMLKTGARLLKAERDELLLLHVQDVKQTGLIPVATRLQHEYDIKVQGMKLNAAWYNVQKTGGQNEPEVLGDLANALHVNVMVVGSYGGLDLIERNLVNRGSSHLCIVKSTSYDLQGNTVWLCATDNSKAAQTAFIMMLHRFYKAGDTVHVVYSTSQDVKAEHLQPYKDIMDKLEVEGKCHMIPVTPPDSVADTILKAAAQVDADILVVGTCGHGNALKLGSVGKECIRKARCTTLVIKDVQDLARTPAKLALVHQGSGEGKDSITVVEKQTSMPSLSRQVSMLNLEGSPSDFSMKPSPRSLSRAESIARMGGIQNTYQLMQSGSGLSNMASNLRSTASMGPGWCLTDLTQPIEAAKLKETARSHV